MSTAANPNAAPDASCAECGAPFRRRRKWAKFCSDTCRSTWHSKQSETGLRGVVSVVVRFDLDERDRAQGLTPGDVLEVLR